MLQWAATSKTALHESVLPCLNENHRSLFFTNESTEQRESSSDDSNEESMLLDDHTDEHEDCLLPERSEQNPCLQDLLQTLADVIPPKYSNRTKIQALRSALVVVDNDSHPIQRLYQLMRPIHLLHELISGRTLSTNILNLDEYIGDVYCVMYLLGTMAKRFRRFLLLSDGRSSSYMDFVHRHASTLSHEKVLTIEQRQRYGILDLPYHTIQCSNDEHDETSTMTLIYDDFAPLGPQFRGRDIVRTLDVCRSHFTSNWIRQAHEQCRIRRPMTVRPPEVRFGGE